MVLTFVKAQARVEFIGDMPKCIYVVPIIIKWLKYNYSVK